MPPCGLWIACSSLRLGSMPDTYADLLAKNLRAARASADLSQADVAERMRALGFRSWLSQTMSASERAVSGNRQSTQMSNPTSNDRPARAAASR